MARTVETDVLVVGSGPSGLTLACGLARHGVRTHLIDHRRDRDPHSRALVLQVRSLEIFDQLGMAASLIPQGNAIAGMRLHVGGRLVTDAELFRAARPDCRYRGALFLEQNRTEAALDACLLELGGETHFGHELVELRDDGSSSVAQCTDASGAPYEVHARYVVGCDGAHSVVRKQCDIAFEGAPYEQDFILADVDLKWEQATDRVHVFLHREGFLVVLPMRERVRLVAAGDAPTVDPDRPSLEDFRSLFARWVPYPAEIDRPSWLARFSLHHRIAERYVAGTTALVGDAAHIHSPVGGQGMNTGIQDAWNLAWKLAWALRCEDSSDARTLIDSYEEERRPVGLELLRTTDRAFEFVASGSSFARFVRGTIAPLLGRFAGRSIPMRARLVERITQLAIGYPDSSLVGPASGNAELSVGSRVPNIEIDGRRLHDLLPKTAPLILSLGRTYSHGRVDCLNIEDPTEAQRQAFGLREPTLFVIRPDAHVAAHAAEPLELERSPLLGIWERTR